MTEPAHHLAGVTVIVRVTPVRRVETQLPTFVDGADILVDGVDGFQDSAVQFLEFAQFRRLLHAVVFHVVVTVGRLEYRTSGQGETVHVGEFAVACCVVVVGGPETDVR